MKEEARLLGITRYFDGGVYGALDDYKSFFERDPDSAHSGHRRIIRAINFLASATAMSKSKK